MEFPYRIIRALPQQRLQNERVQKKASGWQRQRWASRNDRRKDLPKEKKDCWWLNWNAWTRLDYVMAWQVKPKIRVYFDQSVQNPASVGKKVVLHERVRLRQVACSYVGVKMTPFIQNCIEKAFSAVMGFVL